MLYQRVPANHDLCFGEHCLNRFAGGGIRILPVHLNVQTFLLGDEEIFPCSVSFGGFGCPWVELFLYDIVTTFLADVFEVELGSCVVIPYGECFIFAVESPRHPGSICASNCTFPRSKLFVVRSLHSFLFSLTHVIHHRPYYRV